MTEKVKNYSTEDIFIRNNKVIKTLRNRLLKLSNRSSYPFVDVKLGSIPSDIAHSELFGHEKGAFTGAISKKNGIIYQAKDGTLFLDEIESIDQRLLSFFIRFFEKNVIRPMGAFHEITVNARIIVAAPKNIDLSSIFTTALLQRLNIVIDLPLLSND